MLDKVLEALRPQTGGVYVDATLGAGGHASAILRVSSPGGRVIGLDADCDFLGDTLSSLKEEFGDRITAECTFYDHLAEVLGLPVDGVLLDLGISSWHLECSHRGFSFLREEVLDMRLNPSTGPSAAELLNGIDVGDLQKILRTYGEERYAGRIAKAIIKARPIQTSAHLADIVVSATPKPRGRSRNRIHPATRTFQALRIAVNDELNRLERVLPQAIAMLKSGGRCVVISFHSLEDRIVKNAFRAAQKEGAGEVMTKKPLRPSDAEQRENPRSRSAKLRIFAKI